LKQSWILTLALLLAGGFTCPSRAAAQPLDPLATEGEVAMRVIDFGVGGAARQGEYVGIRLEILDRGDRQREIVLRAAIPDADGDRALYERTVATNPGQRQETWLYCRLPFRFDGTLGGELLITAHAAVEAAGEREFRAGRRLGALQARRNRLLTETEGMIGVIGQEPLGLLRFEEAAPGSFQDGGHEPLRPVRGMSTGGLPDRPEGLLQFQALIWAGTDNTPQRLSADQTDALGAWIRWGGRLIIVVPVTETWSAGPLNNPLADIMPQVRFERHDSTPIAPLRPLLVRPDRDEKTLPETATVHTFAPREGAALAAAFTVLADPQGRSLVVSRRVGLGEVTLVGIDLTGSALWRLHSLPDADIFWNRVLGRRGDLSSEEEDGAAGSGGVRTRMIASRSRKVLDAEIGAAISEEGQAAAGVLLGFVVFIAYWVVAGPGLYAVLRKTKRTSHAWVGFVAASLVFTVIAWGGAALIKTRTVRASHISVIDHVYGEPFQRTRSWLSILTPWYGEATVRVAGDGEGAERAFASIAPWSSPSVTLARGFPDARGYTLAGDGASAITYPARSTIKEFQADWLGDPVWHMPRPVGEDPADENPRLTLSPGVPQVGESAVTGSLRHGLPGALERVQVIVVHGQRDVGGLGPAGRVISTVTAYRKTGPWEPGEAFDLGKLTLRDKPGDTPLLENWVDEVVSDVRAESDFARMGSGPGADFTDQLMLASILSQLVEPRTDPTNGVPRSKPHAAALQRQSMHGFDLGHWFRQPCVIIIGHLGASGQRTRSPTPIEVEGRAIEPMGRTLVRWVYPAGEAPPAWRQSAATGVNPDIESPIFPPVPQDGRPLR
jgi:hypothetical protein